MYRYIYIPTVCTPTEGYFESRKIYVCMYVPWTRWYIIYFCCDYLGFLRVVSLVVDRKVVFSWLVN